MCFQFVLFLTSEYLFELNGKSSLLTTYPLQRFMRKAKLDETPDDVQDIIRYTKLRKKYPKLDRELRLKYGYNEKLEKSITMAQMYCIMDELKKHDARKK